MLERACFVLLVGAATACGSEVTPQGGGGSGGGDTGGGDTGGGDIGGADACSAFADEPVGDTLSIVIQNDSPLDVYIPSECGALGVSIVSEADPQGFYGSTTSYCLQTCEELQSESMILCEACAPEAIHIAPFSSRSLEWSTNGLHDVEMPAECWFDDLSIPEQFCNQRILAADGAYAIEALGAFNGCESCDCDPVSGLCSGYPSGAQAFTEPLDFTLPDDDGELVYVIETCAFGCP